MLRKVGLLLIAGLLILPFTSAATRPVMDDQPTVRPAETASLIAFTPAISLGGAGHSELIGGMIAAALSLWYMRSRIA